MGHYWPFSFHHLNTVDKIWVKHIFPMTGFKLRTSGVRSDRSTNEATPLPFATFFCTNQCKISTQLRDQFICVQQQQQQQQQQNRIPQECKSDFIFSRLPLWQMAIPVSSRRLIQLAISACLFHFQQQIAKSNFVQKAANYQCDQMLK